MMTGMFGFGTGGPHFDALILCPWVHTNMTAIHPQEALFTSQFSTVSYVFAEKGQLNSHFEMLSNHNKAAYRCKLKGTYPNIFFKQ